MNTFCINFLTFFFFKKHTSKLATSGRVPVGEQKSELANMTNEANKQANRDSPGHV